MNELIRAIVNYKPKDRGIIRHLAHDRPDLLSARGESGRLPMDIAIASGNSEVILALVRASAPSDAGEIDLKELLVGCLVQISDWYCASWLIDIEFFVWDVIMHQGALPGDPEVIYWDPNDELAQDLVWLFEQLRCWPMGYGGEMIPEQQWMSHFDEWKKKRSV